MYDFDTFMNVAYPTNVITLITFVSVSVIFSMFVVGSNIQHKVFIFFGCMLLVCVVGILETQHTAKLDQNGTLSAHYKSTLTQTEKIILDECDRISDCTLYDFKSTITKAINRPVAPVDQTSFFQDSQDVLYFENLSAKMSLTSVYNKKLGQMQTTTQTQQTPNNQYLINDRLISLNAKCIKPMDITLYTTVDSEAYNVILNHVVNCETN